VEARRIGSLEVSVVGLGCNNLGRRIDEERSREVVEAAVDAGITLLDTADVYGDSLSEEYLGRILRRHRDSVVLATKFGAEIRGEPAGAAPAYIRKAVEGSLRRLRTDRIDLYQLHTPDGSTPIADTLEVLDELVREGKVREIGCSNFNAEQLREAKAAAVDPGAVRFVSVQNELNLLERADEREALPEAERLGLAYIPYFPLASGLLTGKYHRGEQVPEGTRLAGWPDERRNQVLTDATFERIARLTRLAGDRGHTLLELAFAWLLQKRCIASVIAGATRPEQVQANVAAAEWRLSDEDLAAIAELEP
jgi:aryl-alcohol dehydrogenase-like predicted oxidoreductase